MTNLLSLYTASYCGRLVVRAGFASVQHVDYKKQRDKQHVFNWTNLYMEWMARPYVRVCSL